MSVNPCICKAPLLQKCHCWENSIIINGHCCSAACSRALSVADAAESQQHPCACAHDSNNYSGSLSTAVYTMLRMAGVMEKAKLSRIGMTQSGRCCKQLCRQLCKQLCKFNARLTVEIIMIYCKVNVSKSGCFPCVGADRESNARKSEETPWFRLLSRPLRSRTLKCG